MTSTITCPQCSARLKIAKPITGKMSLTCPKCRQAIVARPTAAARQPAGGNLVIRLGIAAAVVAVLAIGVATAFVLNSGNTNSEQAKQETGDPGTVVAGVEEKKQPKKRSEPIVQKKKSEPKEVKTPVVLAPAKDPPQAEEKVQEPKTAPEAPKTAPEQPKSTEEKSEPEDKQKQEYNRLVAEGDKARDGKQYKEALALYEKARVLYPTEESLFQKVELVEKALAEPTVRNLPAKGREENADPKNKADTVVGTPEFQARVAAARKWIAAGKLLEASQELAAARRLDPTSPVVGDLVAQLEQLATAQADPNATRSDDQDKINQDNFNSLIQLATTARNINRWGDADQYFRLALQLKPDDPQTKQALLDLAQARTTAAAKYDQLVAQGLNLLQMLQPANAIECFQAANLTFPEKDAVRPLIQQAQALQASLQRYATAMQQGQAFLNQKNYPQARNAFTAALAEFPQKQEAQTALNNVIQLINNPPAINNTPNNPPIINNPPVVVVVNPTKTPQKTPTADQKKTLYTNAMNAGLAAYQARNYPLAAAQFQFALTNVPGDPQATYWWNMVRNKK